MAKEKVHSMALFETIMKLKSPEECCKFFEDLCTPAELRAMEQRFDVARMLHAGKVYTAILNETGASSATVSRVNRVLNYGTGALGEIMDRVAEEKGESQPDQQETEQGGTP